MVQQLVDNDTNWRSSLRGLNAELARQIVSGAEVEAYIQDASGVKFDNVFDQYLRMTMVPVLKWSNVVDGFDMPISVTLTAGSKVMLEPRQK